MTEPKITVTEEDRRAAAEASRRHVSPSIEQWIKDGVSAFHKFVPIDIGVGLEMNAIAIARARTMAALEERARCVRCCDDAGAGPAAIANISNRPFHEVDKLMDDRVDGLSDDDIRELVLAGW